MVCPCLHREGSAGGSGGGGDKGRGEELACCGSNLPVGSCGTGHSVA